MFTKARLKSIFDKYDVYSEVYVFMSNINIDLCKQIIVYPYNAFELS